jgi:hypothetical protein
MTALHVKLISCKLLIVESTVSMAYQHSKATRDSDSEEPSWL